MSKEQAAVKATYFSIIGNTCLAIIKGLAGFLQFYALIADAIESTTDIFASLLCYLESSILIGLLMIIIPMDTVELSL
jgi:divalent metal cation (Fe/Co/Zn/Cd) transporter